jgi:hypothetical protein
MTNGEEFDDRYQEFLKQNLEPLDRELLMDEELEPEYVGNLSGDPMDLAMRENDFQRAETARERLAIRTAERQAESQDRHATWMKWLTVALTVATIAQVVVAFVR